MKKFPAFSVGILGSLFLATGCNSWAPQLTGIYTLDVTESRFEGGPRMPTHLLPGRLEIQDEATFNGTGFSHRLSMKFEDTASPAELAQRQQGLVGFSQAELSTVSAMFSLDLSLALHFPATGGNETPLGISITSGVISETGSGQNCQEYVMKELTLALDDGIEEMIQNAYPNPNSDSNPQTRTTIYARDALRWELKKSVAEEWQHRVESEGLKIQVRVKRREHGRGEASGCSPGDSIAQDNRSELIAVYKMSPEVAMGLAWDNPNRLSYSSDVGENTTHSTREMTHLFMPLVP